MDNPELDAVRRRYAKRDDGARYSARRPEIQCMTGELRREVGARFRAQGWTDLSRRIAAEVGCGGGGNLVDLVAAGFSARNLIGIELLGDRIEIARRKLPDATFICGDACEAAVPPQSQDVVLVFTVFSSLLDHAFRRRLAAALWQWLRPGGGVLWYDFTIDNPLNPDVRGVPVAAISALFPEGRVSARRITLAPPIARLVCRAHPRLYGVFNAIPLLRTHVLAWIGKPSV